MAAARIVPSLSLSLSLSLFSYHRVSRGAFSSVEHRNYYQEEGDKVGRAILRETSFRKLRIIYGYSSLAAGGRKRNFKSFHVRMEQSDRHSSATTWLRYQGTSANLLSLFQTIRCYVVTRNNVRILIRDNAYVYII